jgi:hypothetical protein
MRLSRHTKDAVRLNLKSLIVALSIFLASYIILFFYAANLLDVKMIVSLLVLEVPSAIVLSRLLGENRKVTVQDAIEKARAIQDFSHLTVHTFNHWPYPFTVIEYVMETGYRTAFPAPDYIQTLADARVIPTIKHKNQKTMHQHFNANSISYHEEDPTANDLRQ